MRINEPPERSPDDRQSRSTIRSSDQSPLPAYSAPWATGGRLAIAAIILLLAAVYFAKLAAPTPPPPADGFSVQREAPAKAPSLR